MVFNGDIKISVCEFISILSSFATAYNCESLKAVCIIKIGIQNQKKRKFKVEVIILHQFQFNHFCLIVFRKLHSNRKIQAVNGAVYRKASIKRYFSVIEKAS